MNLTVNSPQHSGRNIIILMVLFLALLLPIGFTFSYFQDTLTSDAAVPDETETQNATPLLASADIYRCAANQSDQDCKSSPGK